MEAKHTYKSFRVVEASTDEQALQFGCPYCGNVGSIDKADFEKLTQYFSVGCEKSPDDYIFLVHWTEA